MEIQPSPIIMPEPDDKTRLISLVRKSDCPCEFCDTDQSQTKKLVTVARQRQGQWFVVEDVPAWVCPNCGHRYFDVAVLEAMEDGIKTRPTSARPITGWTMSLPQIA